MMNTNMNLINDNELEAVNGGGFCEEATKVINFIQLMMEKRFLKNSKADEPAVAKLFGLV